MRSRRIGIFGAVILMLVIGCTMSSDAASSKFAAKVNGTGIENKALDAAVKNFIENQKMFGAEVKEEDMDELRNGVLQELISVELLYQESKKAKLGDLSKEIEAQLENIKSGFESEDKFKDLLKERGLSEKDLKEDVKKGVYIGTFLEKNVYSKVAINDADKKAEFENNQDKLDVPEQIRVSHILIKVEKDATLEDKAGAREKIEALRKRVISGEDFAEVAKESSEDASASNGGDIGYFGRGMTVPSFENTAFALTVGEISDVVETQFGYHVIKLLDKKDARKLSYEEVEPEITRFLISRQREKLLEEFMNGLKDKAKIKIY